jgi:hypothetical protein
MQLDYKVLPVLTRSFHEYFRRSCQGKSRCSVALGNAEISEWDFRELWSVNFQCRWVIFDPALRVFRKQWFELFFCCYFGIRNCYSNIQNTLFKSNFILAFKKRRVEDGEEILLHKQQSTGELRLIIRKFSFRNKTFGSLTKRGKQQLMLVKFDSTQKAIYGLFWYSIFARFVHVTKLLKWWKKW